MTDLLTHLRNYGEEFTVAQTEISLEDVREHPAPMGPPATRQPRGWLVAFAAALSLIVLIGGVVLGFRLLTGTSGEISDEPAVTTTVPPATTVPPTTVPAPTTVAPTTVPPTTTGAPSTTATPPTTQAPLAEPLPPYNGPVPDLSEAWVLQATAGGDVVAVHPELGFVGFGERETEGFMSAAEAYYSPDGEMWEVATGFDAPEGDPGQPVRFAVAGPAGFVAAILDGPVVFFSADGRVWEPPVSPWSNGGANDLAAGSPGYVLVGGTYDCEARGGFSSDGITWQATDLPDLPSGCYWSAVTWTGSRFVLMGTGSGGVISHVLTSTDGLAWTEVDVAQPPAPIGTWGVHLAGSADTLALLGTEPDVAMPTELALWYSTDLGRNWFEAEIRYFGDEDPPGEYQAWQLIHSEHGFFAVGGIETGEDSVGEVGGFLLWSPDGATWYRYVTQDGEAPGSLAVADDTVFGFGDGVWTLDWPLS